MKLRQLETPAPQLHLEPVPLPFRFPRPAAPFARRPEKIAAAAEGEPGTRRLQPATFHPFGGRAQ